MRERGTRRTGHHDPSNCAPTLHAWAAFRVLVAGPRHFTNDPVRRAALDVRLDNRLPDVELLT